MDQSSISIINKNNGQVTGESTAALPIRLVTSNLAVKFFAYGFLTALAIFIIFILVARKQVTVVDVSGKSPSYQEFNLN
jgi:hypothetical protein